MSEISNTKGEIQQNTTTTTTIIVISFIIQATSLDLSHNSIGTVEASMFPAYLPRLRHLNLLGCGIHTLEHDAFNHLPALEELGLEHNQITAIHAGGFVGEGPENGMLLGGGGGAWR